MYKSGWNSLHENPLIRASLVEHPSTNKEHVHRSGILLYQEYDMIIFDIWYDVIRTVSYQLDNIFWFTKEKYPIPNSTGSSLPIPPLRIGLSRRSDLQRAFGIFCRKKTPPTQKVDWLAKVDFHRWERGLVSLRKLEAWGFLGVVLVAHSSFGSLYICVCVYKYMYMYIYPGSQPRFWQCWWHLDDDKPMKKWWNSLPPTFPNKLWLDFQAIIFCLQAFWIP